jgi:hypothetical protein
MDDIVSHLSGYYFYYVSQWDASEGYLSVEFRGTFESAVFSARMVLCFFFAEYL